VKTIGIDLWGGQARGVPNNPTMARRVARPRHGVRELFLASYARFAPLCRDVDEPGIAMLAIDETTGNAAGLVRLRARFDRYVAGIVGRHDQCDLFLPTNVDLALRHLAIVLDPVKSWSRNSSKVGYRVLDLRTTGGFCDEDDRPLRGLRADGPAVIRCAGHVIVILPLGDPTDWPERADDAWAMLPERVYFDELDHVPSGSMPRMLPRQTRQSVVMRTHGPRDTGQGLVEGGDIAGTLELHGKSRSGVITVGADALRDGVLLGRYARCDGAALLDDPKLSRVHALLLHVDDALLAIDGNAEQPAERSNAGACERFLEDERGIETRDERL
jgi:hypothetical protein